MKKLASRRKWDAFPRCQPASRPWLPASLREHTRLTARAAGSSTVAASSAATTVPLKAAHSSQKIVRCTWISAKINGMSFAVTEQSFLHMDVQPSLRRLFPIVLSQCPTCQLRPQSFQCRREGQRFPPCPPGCQPVELLAAMLPVLFSTVAFAHWTHAGGQRDLLSMIRGARSVGI